MLRSGGGEDERNRQSDAADVPHLGGVCRRARGHSAGAGGPGWEGAGVLRHRTIVYVHGTYTYMCVHRTRYDVRCTFCTRLPVDYVHRASFDVHRTRTLYTCVYDAYIPTAWDSMGHSTGIPVVLMLVHRTMYIVHVHSTMYIVHI